MGGKKTYAEKLLDPKWQKKRLKVLTRDDFQCQQCADTENTLDVHHISYSSCDPWDIDLKLLITLCRPCHEDEQKSVTETARKAVSELKSAGFMSTSFDSLSKIFSDTDRGWGFYEPAFDVIKTLVDDDNLWQQVEAIFWSRLHERREKEGSEFHGA